MSTVKAAVSAVLAVMAVAGGTAAAATARSSPPTPARPHSWAHVVNVSATDFSFTVKTEGRVPAGLVTLKLANRGSNDHQAVLARLHRGVTLTRFAQALKSSGQAALRLADVTGGPGTVTAGHGQTTVQALQGGQYAVLCFVAGPDTIPHLMKGMIAGFAVSGRLTSAQLAALRPSGHVDGTITAHDMTYTLPSALRGHGLYRFANTATSDTHELGIVRLHPGATAADVAAWLHTHAGPPPFTSAGGYGAVLPGGHGWLRLNLAPGRYAALCFVPDDSGPHAPHAAMGMVVPFTATR